MRLSEKHSSDMLDAFSHELVNIKKEFETRLTESIQSIRDDFLAGTYAFSTYIGPSKLTKFLFSKESFL